MVFFLILEAIELEVNLFPFFLECLGMIEPLLTSFNMFFLNCELGNHLDLDLDLGLGKIGERKGMSLVFVIIVYFFI